MRVTGSNLTQKLSVVLLAVALSACGSAPKRDLALERLQAEWREVGTSSARSKAPLEHRDAEQALDALARGEGSEAERAELAFVAEQRLQILRVAVAGADNRDRLAALELERQQILLEATRRDAELARIEAEKLRLQSLARAEEAERMRREAETESARRLASEELAELAQQEAEAARRLADAQSREAGLARREAELASAQALSLRQQLASIRAVSSTRGLVITLGDAYFASGQSQLAAAARENLGSIMEILARYPEQQVSVEGHTDSSGSDEANLSLSQQRAQSVREALVAQGADPNRIVATGFGETQPIASNDNSQGRARNRRVEIVIEGAQ